MAIEVIKRNNERVPFDKTKIENAINNAFLEVDGILYETDTAKDIADEVEAIAKVLYNNPKADILSVERI